MGRERRQYDRIAMADIVVCCRFEDGAAMHGELENISQGGCYIQGEEFAGCCRWEPCTVSMQMDMPSEQRSFPARLIWSDLRGAGFSFCGLDEATEGWLVALVRSRGED